MSTPVPNCLPRQGRAQQGREGWWMQYSGGMLEGGRHAESFGNRCQEWALHQLGLISKIAYSH